MCIIRILFVVLALCTMACGSYDDLCDLNVPNKEDDMPSRRLYGQTVHWRTGAANLTETVINVAEPVSQCGDVTPPTWGIQVQGIINRNAFNGKADRPALKGRVFWGVLGGQFTADFDVTRGVSFNLVADTVRVDIIDTTVYAGAPATIEPFTVTGSAAPVPVPKTTPLTYTVPVNLNNPYVDRPSFSRNVSMSVFKQLIPGTGYAVGFIDANGTDVLGIVFVGDGGELVNFPIPGPTDRIAMDNIGVNILGANMIFDLDL